MNIGDVGRGINLPFLRRNLQEGPHERRLPGFKWLPNRIRNHFIAMIGEFVGTFLFLFFAFSATQVANASTSDAGSGGDGSLTQAPNAGALLYISLAFGFSLAVNAWVFFRITGGLFNPAVRNSIITKRRRRTDSSIGHPWVVPDWSSEMVERSSRFHLATLGVHGCSRNRSVSLPWANERLYNSRRRCIDCSRLLHRNVPYSTARIHHFYARCRKAQGNLYCTDWHWIVTIHCRIVGSVCL